MCGIVGLTGYHVDDAALQRGVAALHHRGPDGHGTFVSDDRRVGFGHARLAVVDLCTGAQPLFSEERDLVLVCNGEIYDNDRLRAELEARGHVFSTRSDSALILHLYQEYGRQCVDHLRGEFAFLLYDHRAGLVLAVRDRFGIKPLFFNQQNGKFLFASEAKALFATGLLRPRLNTVALRDYLSGVIPDSVFEGVEAVPPGCMLVVDLRNGQHQIDRYWDVDLTPDDEAPERTDADVIAQVRDAVDEAVRLRLRADVPVGVYLSGGVDSAVVAAAVARYRPGTLKAFTISFPDDRAFNELEGARSMAAHLGAECHTLSCDRDALFANTEDFLWVSELPFLNFHGVGKFLLSRLASQHVKVVLTGEGADEVFLGYVYFQPGKGTLSEQMGNRLRARKSPGGADTARVVSALGFLPLHEHAQAFSSRGQDTLRRLFRAGRRRDLQATHPLDRLKERLDRGQTDARPPVRQIQYFSIKSLLAPYILTSLGDRSELAHGVEGRPPFLDHRLFELMRGVPDRLKIRAGVEKWVLREAFKDRVTDAICRAKKWPYFAPRTRVRRGDSAALDRLLDKYLSPAAVEASGIFSPARIRVIRFFLQWWPVENRLTRTLDLALVFVLSVHVLERQYVREFEKNLQDRTAPAESAGTETR